MVSRDFLASPYITSEERPLAMKLVREKKAMVLPVILSDCSYSVEDFARFENLPSKGHSVHSFNPREKAWALVEEGTKKAVEQRNFSRLSSPNPRLM